MDITVFHDDQHGTAIVCLAGLINALEITGKKIDEIKVVVNGAGAAGIACLKLILEYGAKKENCTQKWYQKPSARHWIFPSKLVSKNW